MLCTNSELFRNYVLSWMFWGINDTYSLQITKLIWRGDLLTSIHQRNNIDHCIKIILIYTLVYYQVSSTAEQYKAAIINIKLLLVYISELLSSRFLLASHAIIVGEIVWPSEIAWLNNRGDNQYGKF